MQRWCVGLVGWSEAKDRAGLGVVSSKPGGQQAPLGTTVAKTQDLDQPSAWPPAVWQLGIERFEPGGVAGSGGFGIESISAPDRR